MFNSQSYFWGETMKSLSRNRFMAVASVLTVTLSMFILGIFLCVVLNINHMASHLEDQVEMSVYLKENLTTQEVMNLGKKLKVLPGRKEITFTNKEQAMIDFREQLGEQSGLLEALNGNPLPSSYKISFDTPEALTQSADLVKGYPEVESVQYGKEIIEQLYHLAQIIRITGVVLIVFLAGAELFIISNTIRLTVFARRKEIEIMKYVGATNGFIRWPFINEGMVIGFIGSAIASIFLWFIYAWVLDKMMDAGIIFIPMIPLWPDTIYIILTLLISGLFIGVMGSAISLRRYMKV